MNPGITLRKHGIEFAIHSSAGSLRLMLFDRPEDETPIREIAMKRKHGLWHALVPYATPGQFYLYKNGENQWLLDPCAKAVHFPRTWADTTGLTAGIFPAFGTMFPKGVIIDDRFAWGTDRPPNTPLNKSVIYETHLRGFTGSGNYLDFIEKIPYLKELGITAVEFLPLFEFNELEFFLKGGSREHLLNFWGYSTLGFFAPMSRYASSPEPGAAVSEFKTLVRALHEAGIEIILDVVFNHTAEAEQKDGTYHFQGLDEDTYYLKDKNGAYQNWSGCGNTVNANHPVTRQFIVNCLKYWVQEMHVDGFRFDLATSLCRGNDGTLLEKPPLIKAIEAEPALKHIKLIAEAWDCGGYQVGHFPGKRFSDWNGKFRDDIRRFWNHRHPVGELATRLAGSSDLYRHKGSSPLHSINFITAHDGFTLADLVSYEQKHNEANGEENRDGENHNDSINFGVEGPSDNPAINARRLQQQKNLLATLFLSQGVPMLLAGDEFGRTQQGNNNAYCQDNEISWVDWSLLEKNKELFEFTKQLIALRKAHPALRRKTFFTGKGDVKWIGPDGKDPDWNNGHALGMHITGKDELLILINNEEHDVSFEEHMRPDTGSGAQAQPVSKDWKLELSSAPVDSFTLPPQSLAVYTVRP
ncbi:glycogen debranching protein GlgX [Tichowtungia aerotolerans]|uniref:Glycogen debranching protein GlgX n=1 Tax=Tichowtungia aerotolerans TaxID=2697043 RepID=A0A6P1M834_9BACT|nr:glycogen debranching protein GlgX [Tichowtungia aerotolerans]QHI68318.1 glycogen debranching protein GlgX [Tichowtungia aerotolerans]